MIVDMRPWRERTGQSQYTGEIWDPARACGPAEIENRWKPKYRLEPVNLWKEPKWTGRNLKDRTAPGWTRSNQSEIIVFS